MIRNHEPGLEQHIIPLLPRDTAGTKILDIGTGSGFWAYALRVLSDGIPIITGLDICDDFEKMNQRTSLYDRFIVCDAAKTHLMNFDYVLCIETIEHLEKEDGLYLLEKIKMCTRKRAILSTPYGFMRIQNDAMPNMNHLSGWHVSDFTDIGYTAQVVDSRNMTRTTKLFDDLRRLVFHIPTTQFIIAQYDAEVKT